MYELESIFDRVQNGRRGWIVSTGVLRNHLLGLAEDDAPSHRGVFQKFIQQPLRLAFGLQEDTYIEVVGKRAS